MTFRCNIQIEDTFGNIQRDVHCSIQCFCYHSQSLTFSFSCIIYSLCTFGIQTSLCTFGSLEGFVTPIDTVSKSCGSLNGLIQCCILVHRYSSGIQSINKILCCGSKTFIAVGNVLSFCSSLNHCENSFPTALCHVVFCSILTIVVVCLEAFESGNQWSFGLVVGCYPCIGIGHGCFKSFNLCQHFSTCCVSHIKSFLQCSILCITHGCSVNQCLSCSLSSFHTTLVSFQVSLFGHLQSVITK